MTTCARDVRRSRWLALLFAAAAVAASEARPQQPQRAPGVTRETVRAILVDVVVRDKRGQPVRDLTAADFELTEDGVAQAIGSFAPVFEGTGVRDAEAPAAAAAAASPGTPGPTPGGPMVTALVFDRLSPEARHLAVQAAKTYLGTQTETPSYVGIFGIDLGMAPYAPFTRNARLLREALDRMSTRASAGFNSPELQQQKASAKQAAAAAERATAGAIAGAAGGGGSVGTAAGDAMLAQIQARMIEDFDVMEHDQQGYATTNGLFAIVQAMRGLPGRKSMVFFSEGIAIPPAVQRLFLGVIDAANRANVTIYTMDAAGLRTESELAKIRDQVNDKAGGGGGILGGSSADGSAPLSKSMEANEYVLRQDPHYGLGTLAQDTGGLLFDNTNNLRQGFERVETDLRNYYLLSYSPTNDRYDGRFRTIEVKVKRPGVTVAARKGYFGVRDLGDSPVNSWEAPALGKLERKPVPNEFPVRAAGLLFPERQRPGLVPVLVSVGTSAFTFAPAADKKTYSSDFAIMVRFLDDKNQVVRKVSQHYEVKGPIGEIARATQGEVLFYREPELPPGVYTMETIVYDAPSERASVRISTVDVPKESAGALRMSSLVLVKRAEKVADKDRRADNPLMVKDIVLFPNLGEPISKAAKELGFYFTVYATPGAPPPTASLTLQLNGTPVAQLPMTLSPADASGRIQQLGRLPLDQLAPGSYELVVDVTQAAARASRSTLVRIID